MYGVSEYELTILGATTVHKAKVVANGIVANIVIQAEGSWRSTDVIVVLPESLRPSAEQFISGSVSYNASDDFVDAPAPFSIGHDGNVRQRWTINPVGYVYLHSTYIIA